MQIVIDIPIEWLFDMKNKKFCQTDSLYQKILNGTPLEKIRAEIKEERKVEHIPEDVEKWDYIRALDRTLSIIDKYKTESEE